MRWFVLLLVIPSASWASIGNITDFTGSGAIERDRKVIEGGSGVTVESMDTAVTAKGRMRIDFIDDTRVDITEHSRLVIDEFVYDPANDIGSLSLKASLGTVRYASGSIAKRYKQNVKIKTPSATIGVRGTDFIMVVDEIGGSMITLLPSCVADPITREPLCVTGEIVVESDAGFVIMNQAFQTTMVKHGRQPPSPPLIIDFDENDINNLLIVRKKGPYEEEEDEIRKRTKRMFEFLDIDFLQFDGLETDALTDDIKDIWVTDLDKNDYYLQELLHDIIDQMNLALAELFRNELDKQNEEFFRQREYGFDEKTRITITDENPFWHYVREDVGVRNRVDIYLNQNYGYTINVEQADEAVYDYRLGVGNNTIDITQVQ